MKRRAMIRKIARLLKTWENCQLNEKTAREVLDLVERNGMLPPGQEKDRVVYKTYTTNEILGFGYEKYEWEEE
jgi:hypothetical protein